MDFYAIFFMIFLIFALMWVASRTEGPPTPRRSYDSPFRRDFNPEYVYFIGDSHGGPTKIGMSRSDPHARLKSIQTGNPRRLGFRLLLEVSDAAAAERKLHRRFASKRLHGEWFNLSSSDMRSVKYGI